uniref:Magnesium transporter NIPA2 n=1 Tax=Ditylenchus dipsaci TaxID=166011 RepID=A0A915DUP2_9BILA
MCCLARNVSLGQDALKTVNAELGDKNLSNILFHQLDITDENSCKSFADFLKREHGSIDVLINNAGIDATESAFEQADICISTNYYGTKTVSKHLVPLIQSGGRQSGECVQSIRCHENIYSDEHIKKFKSSNYTEEDIDNFVEEYKSVCSSFVHAAVVILEIRQNDCCRHCFMEYYKLHYKTSNPLANTSSSSSYANSPRSPSLNIAAAAAAQALEMSESSTRPPESIVEFLSQVSGKSGSNLVDFYIGLGLAVSSSIFIGSSFIIKKKALIKLANTTDYGQRASEGGYGYLREWLWWMGVITMGVGECCNFAAYTFAPASLVTPLGALSVLVTAVLSSKLLKERLHLHCDTFSKEEEVSNMAELATKMKDAVFILYVVFVILVTLGIVFYLAPRYGRSNILVYIAVCSLIGSLSVISVKGLGLAIKETITGSQQFTNMLTWFWLLSVIACVSVQLIYLNKSLDIYNTSMVTPIYYVFFTTFVILASSILYKEWSCLGASDIIGNMIGFLTTIIGIFQMQLFRDVELPPFRKFRDYCKLRESASSPHMEDGGIRE